MRIKREAILLFILTFINLASAATSGQAIFETSNFTVFVDNDAPLVFIFSPLNITYSSPILVNYSVFDYSLDSIWYSLDNGLNISVSDNFYLNLSNGDYNLKIFANDSFSRMNFSKVYFSVNNSNHFCGDAICGSDETCGSCAVDCGQCPVLPQVSGSSGGAGGGSEKKVANKTGGAAEETQSNEPETESPFHRASQSGIEEESPSAAVVKRIIKKSSILFFIILLIVFIAAVVSYYLYENLYFKKHFKIIRG